MSNENTCPKCGGETAGSDVGGLCPKCLMLGAEEEAGATRAGGIDGGPWSERSLEVLAGWARERGGSPLDARRRGRQRRPAPAPTSLLTPW